jgi:dihydrofolate reductase
LATIPDRRDGGATGQAFRSHVRWDSEQARSARIAESVARSVCGLVRTTTVLSRCDRGADEKWRRQSSEYGPVNARRASRESNEMRPLRYSINVTLDGCCHHEAGLPPDEESMRYWTAEMERADALLFGRVTYEMMESAWRQPATGTWPDWMDEWEIPFAETIDRAKKYVVSSTLSGVDWNAELVRGDLGQAVQRLKQEPGEGLFVGGVTLPLALADLGLIDEYEFLVQPVLAGHGPTLLAGLRERIQLELVDRHEFRSGAVAVRYRPTRVTA